MSDPVKDSAANGRQFYPRHLAALLQRLLDNSGKAAHVAVDRSTLETVVLILGAQENMVTIPAAQPDEVTIAACKAMGRLREWCPPEVWPNALGLDGDTPPLTDFASAFRGLLDALGMRCQYDAQGYIEFVRVPTTKEGEGNE